MRLDTKQIKNIMLLDGIKPKKLAKKLNKSDSWVYLMLQGKAGKTFKIVRQLAKVLNCKEKDIIWFEIV